jgi:hypothetical protein
MIDLSLGGQMGWGLQHAQFASNAAYVRPHIMPFLLESPLIFKYFPNSPSWIAALRALIETQWLTVEGLNAELRAQFNESPFGGSGLKQRDLTNVTEEESRPKHTYLERMGRPIGRFTRHWMTMAGMDPQTKLPLITTLASAAGIPDLLPDMTSATCLYIEPDQMGRKVQQAWIVYSMFPEGTGPVVGSADKSQDRQVTNIELQFTGIHRYGPGVDSFAQRVLDAQNFIGANPNLSIPEITEINADVRAAGTGFAQGVTNIQNRQVAV